MTKDIIFLYYVNLLFDAATILVLRELVYSFLLTKRNVKSGKKIHQQQSLKERVTLAYIKEYTLYPKKYNLFQKMRVACYVEIIPKYVLLGVVTFFHQKNSLILLIILGVLKMIILLIPASQFVGKISKFDKRCIDHYKKRRR